MYVENRMTLSLPTDAEEDDACVSEQEARMDEEEEKIGLIG